ncbi:hypothetical protein [Streptomyces sp. NPDC001070]
MTLTGSKRHREGTAVAKKIEHTGAQPVASAEATSGGLSIWVT